MKKCLWSHAYFDVTNRKYMLETQSFKDQFEYLHWFILTEKNCDIQFREKLSRNKN
jgi:hypothetical protein